MSAKGADLICPLFTQASSRTQQAIHRSPRVVDEKDPLTVWEATHDLHAVVMDSDRFEATPKRRYMVVTEQREAEIRIRKQIEPLVQLNEGQPYTYDRDSLVRMLDEALAQARPRQQNRGGN